MNKRIWLVVIVFSLGLALVVGGAGLAQKSTAALAPDVALGEPGLSFRYVKQLGETQVPYLADAQHLYWPNGVFVDSTGKVYVTEELGRRLLKYDASGANLLSIGTAGVCNSTETSFCQTWDALVDTAGYLWVVDNDRLVQFDADGNFVQQLGWGGEENYYFSGGTRGAAADADGHLFVSDTWRHRIQVYDLTSGTPVYSSTLGVTDTPGSDLGSFNAPHRLAVDSLGRLLVADRENGRIQRCTYSGGWSCVLMDGEVSYPEGVAVDSSNNVYSTDYFYSRVRKCTAPGVCTDLITDTPEGPHDVALDAAGNLYVSMQYDQTVRKYTSTGQEIGVFAGVPGVPYLTDAEHYNRARLEVDDAGSLYILEENGHRLVKLDAQGNFQWQFGVAGVNGNDNAHLSSPHAVDIKQDGNVYIADNCRVVLLAPDGYFSGAIGNCGDGDYEFSWPTGVAVADDGTLYVADFHNHRVQVYNNSLTYVDTLGVTGECLADNDHLCTPIGVAVDAAGNVYVADGGNNRIQKFNPEGEYLTTIAAGWGEAFGQFNWAEDVDVDAQGRVYVADWNNQRVQVFSPGGAFLTSVSGVWGLKSSQFNGVASVAVDSLGNLYVGDWENTRIQVFAPGYPGWQQVNINGFGNKWNVNAASMEAFKERLYVGTANWTDGGATVWRTANGTTWEQASQPGFSEEDLSANGAVIDFAVFGGDLYASTGWRGLPGQVWRSPDGLNWEQVEDNGFDDPGNWAICIFGMFENQLYVSTSGTDGAEIWRSSTGDDGDWERVVENGKGDPDNTFITDLVVYNDQFFAMVESNADPKTGLQIWQSTDGSIWTTVVADGFGDPENYQTGGATVFDGMLYAGTNNALTGGQVWRTSDGIHWTQVGQAGLTNPSNQKIENLFVANDRLFATAINQNGTQLYSSPDGEHWTHLVADGFGESNNEWPGWTGSEFHGQLYLATHNSGSGIRIWRMWNIVTLPLVVKH